MLDFVQAIEIRAYGVFKDSESAKGFNKNVGSSLHLYPIRTVWGVEEFKEKYFTPGGDGAYLEQCCGEGNVEIKISKSPFLALRGVSGGKIEQKEIMKFFTTNEEQNKWERGIYKRSMLLTIDEIESLALNPFKFVMIRNFGVVNKKNIDEFKNAVFQMNTNYITV